MPINYALKPVASMAPRTKVLNLTMEIDDIIFDFENLRFYRTITGIYMFDDFYLLIGPRIEINPSLPLPSDPYL